jgi:hypothetical protein
VAYYTTLLPYFTSLKSFTTSSLIFTSPHLTHLTRAQLFSTLSRLCQHPCLQPTGTRNSASLQLVRRNLQSSIDHFEASMLSNFEKAADGNLLAGMKDAAQALWELNGGGSVVQVFFNKIPLFYDQSWDPMRNLTCVAFGLDRPVLLDPFGPYTHCDRVSRRPIGSRLGQWAKRSTGLISPRWIPS